MFLKLWNQLLRWMSSILPNQRLMSDLHSEKFHELSRVSRSSITRSAAEWHVKLNDQTTSTFLHWLKGPSKIENIPICNEYPKGSECWTSRPLHRGWCLRRFAVTDSTLPLTGVIISGRRRRYVKDQPSEHLLTCSTSFCSLEKVLLVHSYRIDNYSLENVVPERCVILF